MNKFKLHFDNTSPDCVEVRAVETLDITGLKIPFDAAHFYFEDEKFNFIPPLYYVGKYAGGVDDFPEYIKGQDKSLVRGFALISHWENPDNKGGKEWSLIRPLYDHTVIIDRDTGEITWPPHISENQPK